jgi:hypothetical protein
MQNATVQTIIDSINDLARLSADEEERWRATDPILASQYQGRKQGYKSAARLLDEMLTIEIVSEARAHGEEEPT